MTERRITYWQSKGGELFTSSEFLDASGSVVAESGGERTRGAKKISKVNFDAAVRRQIDENEDRRYEALQRSGRAREKADAEAAERAAAVRSWLEKMDAPSEVVDALLTLQG